MDSKTPRIGASGMHGSSRVFFRNEECCSALQLLEVMKEHGLHLKKKENKKDPTYIRDTDKWKGL